MSELDKEIESAKRRTLEGYERVPRLSSPVPAPEDIAEMLRNLEERVEVLGVAIGRDPEISAGWCRARNEEIDAARSEILLLVSRLRSQLLTPEEADILLGLTFGMAGTQAEFAARERLKQISLGRRLSSGDSEDTQ